MPHLNDFLRSQPMLPFIRHSDYAVRRPWNIPERKLLDYLLIFIQEGKCLITVEGEEFQFSEQEFCLIQPNTLHKLQGTTNTITPFAHLDFFYNPNRETSFPTRAGQVDLSAYSGLIQPRLNDVEELNIPVKFQPKQPERFRETMLRMVGMWMNRNPISQLEAQCLASDLVLAIIRDHYGASERAEQSPQSLNWFTSYLSFHLSEPLTVEDMAERAHLSASRFSAVFREQFKMPPHRYLLQLRIEHAKDLLRTTQLTLQNIAAYCGFADEHHLSKIFKKITGLSPGAYHIICRSFRKSRGE